MNQLRPETAAIDALQGVTDGVVELVGFEACAVSIAQDPHTLATVVVSGSGGVRDQLLGLRVATAHVEEQLGGSEPWHGLHCIRYDRAHTHRSSDDPAVMAPPLDVLAAPIRDAAGRLRGLVQVDLSRDLGDPDDVAFDVLARFIEQARHAVLNAIDRDRLVERVRLADAARLIVRRASSELSMDRIMELSQPAMASGFEAAGMWMQTFDEDGAGTDLVYGSTEGLVIPDELKTLSRAAAGQLWDFQTVAVVTDRIVPAIEGLLPEEEQKVYDFMTDTLEATSLLFVPLGAGHECLGNLALTREGDTLGWSDTEKQVALDIGHDLGRALLNARTFERERRLAAELRELDGYKTRLISTLAHELKNPLTAIAGHAEILDSMVELPGGARHSIAAMERGATRMRSTIDNLLLLAEIGDGNRPLEATPVDMAKVVDDVVDMLRFKSACKKLKVTFEAPDGPVVVFGEAPGLDLVFSNLISNAVKYTPDGGSVTISLGRTDGEVALAVSDTGIGIGEKDQEQLFHEFFRSTNPVAFAQPGTGLGLAIVQRVVERHRGRIDVSSVLGAGTTFTVTLPAT